MHEKRAHVSFMHSRQATGMASDELHEETMRPYGRIITYMSFVRKILPVFVLNDLLALMLNFQTPGGDAARAERPPYRCGRRWNAVPTGVVRRTANHPSRFPDYVPAPRNAPREMGILYHISISLASWILSIKSDILNFMILYYNSPFRALLELVTAARVEGLAKAFADYDREEHYREKRGTREEDEPPCAAELLRLVHQLAAARRHRREPESEEVERRERTYRAHEKKRK